MLQDSANRKSPTIAHVEGRLKCLLLPNRNVWSAVLSRAHRGALLRAANTDSARFLSSSPTDFFCHHRLPWQMAQAHNLTFCRCWLSFHGKAQNWQNKLHSWSVLALSIIFIGFNFESAFHLQQCLGSSTKLRSEALMRPETRFETCEASSYWLQDISVDIAMPIAYVYCLCLCIAYCLWYIMARNQRRRHCTVKEIMLTKKSSTLQLYNLSLEKV